MGANKAIRGCEKEFIIDLADDEPSSEEIIDQWDTDIRKMLLTISDDESLTKNLEKYLKLLNDVIKYEGNALLRRKIYSHCNFFHNFYYSLDYCNRDSYLSCMENILTIYCDLELQIFSRCDKDPKSKAFNILLTTTSKKIIKCINLFLLENYEHILHVLMRITLDETNNSCLNIFRVISKHFLLFVPIPNYRQDTYCRYYVVMQRFKQYSPRKEWNAMDLFLERRFKNSIYDLNSNSLIDKIRYRPESDDLVDIAFSLMGSFDSLRKSYFKHVASIKKNNTEIDDYLTILLSDDEDEQCVPSPKNDEEEDVRFCELYETLQSQLSNLPKEPLLRTVPRAPIIKEEDDDDAIEFISMSSPPTILKPKVLLADIKLDVDVPPKSPHFDTPNGISKICIASVCSAANELDAPSLELPLSTVNVVPPPPILTATEMPLLPILPEVAPPSSPIPPEVAAPLPLILPAAAAPPPFILTAIAAPLLPILPTAAVPPAPILETVTDVAPDTPPLSQEPHPVVASLPNGLTTDPITTNVAYDFEGRKIGLTPSSDHGEPPPHAEMEALFDAHAAAYHGSELTPPMEAPLDFPLVEDANDDMSIDYTCEPAVNASNDPKALHLRSEPCDPRLVNGFADAAWDAFADTNREFDALFTGEVGNLRPADRSASPGDIRSPSYEAIYDDGEFSKLIRGSVNGRGARGDFLDVGARRVHFRDGVRKERPKLRQIVRCQVEKYQFIERQIVIAQKKLEQSKLRVDYDKSTTHITEKDQPRCVSPLQMTIKLPPVFCNSGSKNSSVRTNNDRIDDRKRKIESSSSANTAVTEKRSRVFRSTEKVPFEVKQTPNVPKHPFKKRRRKPFNS